MKSSEEIRAAARARAAKRYAVKRKDPAWMRQQADKARAKYRAKKGNRPDGRTLRSNRKKATKRLVASLKLARRSCHDCGLIITVDTLYLFDFDHREPRHKSFTLSMVRTQSDAAIIVEAAKCDVVCANCHRHRTYKQRKGEHIDILREAQRARFVNPQPSLF